VVNEPELEETLKDFGFHKVYLEDLSFLQQVALFQNASAIFGQHGAGFTNLIFATAGAHVFELFEPEFVNPCYVILANKLGLNYKILFNTSALRPTPTFHWNNIPYEVQIDCSSIKNMLSQSIL
jgi:capsular polysaccharide biosynthesis protein